MSDIEFEHEETETGGSKRPTKVRLKAMHPEHGQVGWLDYHVPRRKADKIYIDRLEVDPDHRGKGYASQLMDEMQRRHPNTPIDHGDRTDDGSAWWAGYTRDKKVTRGRTMATRKTAADHQVWFHGTRPENVPHIRERGLSAPPGMASPFYMQLTDNHEQAKVYAGPGGKVLEYHIPHGEAADRLGEVHPHNMFNQNGRAAPIRTSVPPEYIAAEHDVPPRTAARKTAAEHTWEFEHHDLGEGGHHRVFGTAPASEGGRDHRMDYKIQNGVLKPTGFTSRAQDDEHVQGALISGAMEHHKDKNLEIYDPKKHDPNPGPPPAKEKPKYYHGTCVPGVSHVMPANHHGKDVVFHSDTDRDYAYASTNHDDAWEYAKKAWAADQHGRRPRVYEVAPIGGHRHVEVDPQFANGRSRGNYANDYRSKKGWKVVREVPMPEHMGDPEEWDR